MSRFGFATLIVAGAVLAWAAEARADVSLSWGDCSVAGTNTRTSACSSNVGEHRIVLTLQSADPLVAIRRFVGAVRVRLFSGGALPEWWNLRSTGGCRPEALTGSVQLDDPPLEDGLCRDPWNGRATLTLYRSYAWDEIQLAMLIELSAPVNLAPGVPYMLGEFRISNLKTVGAGACAGCGAPAYIIPEAFEFENTSGVWASQKSITTLYWQ